MNMKKLIASVMAIALLASGLTIQSTDNHLSVKASSVSSGIVKIVDDAFDTLFKVAKITPTQTRVTLIPKQSGKVYIYDDISWKIKNGKVKNVKIKQNCDRLPIGYEKEGWKYLKNFSDGSALVKSSYSTKCSVGKFISQVFNKNISIGHTEAVMTVWYRIYPNGRVKQHSRQTVFRIVSPFGDVIFQCDVD